MPDHLTLEEERDLYRAALEEIAEFKGKGRGAWMWAQHCVAIPVIEKDFEKIDDGVLARIQDRAEKETN